MKTHFIDTDILIIILCTVFDMYIKFKIFTFLINVIIIKKHLDYKLS